MNKKGVKVINIKTSKHGLAVYGRRVIIMINDNNKEDF